MVGANKQLGGRKRNNYWKPSSYSGRGEKRDYIQALARSIAEAAASAEGR